MAFTIYLSEIDQIKIVCEFWDLYEKLSSFPRKILLGKNFLIILTQKIFSQTMYKSKTLYLGVIVCFKAIEAIRINFGVY